MMKPKNALPFVQSRHQRSTTVENQRLEFEAIAKRSESQCWLTTTFADHQAVPRTRQAPWPRRHDEQSHETRVRHQ